MTLKTWRVKAIAMTRTSETIFEGPGPDEVFSAGLAENEFRIQHCRACDTHVFYPRALCTSCGSPELDWVVARGRGTVYATSVVRQRPEQGENYNIALVDLEEGPRMTTRDVDIAPEDVKIGAAVTAFIGDIDGNQVVLFRPAGEGDGHE